MMKSASITILILILILPVGSYCFSEPDADHLSAGLNLRGPAAAPHATDVSRGEANVAHGAVRWYPRQQNTNLNGVALVIHGLNCRPDKMVAIIEELNANGIDCLNLSLRGHGTNFSPIDNMSPDEARMVAFKSVSYPLWKTEAYKAYQETKKKSDLYGKPLFLIGFSMGGLLGIDLMASNPNVNFEKMVLFAPAIAMHPRNYLIKVLSPFPDLVIPSAGNASYLANEGTPMAAYNAFFEMHAHFENRLDPEKINIPTVVFIDEDDELVSYTSLQKMVHLQHLDQWKIHPVKKDNTATEVKMHHLTIDAASVGKAMWQEIVDDTITHLLNKQSLILQHKAKIEKSAQRAQVKLFTHNAGLPQVIKAGLMKCHGGGKIQGHH